MLLFGNPSDRVCGGTCRGMDVHLDAAIMGDRRQALDQEVGGMDVGRVLELRREMRRAHRLGVLRGDDVDLPPGQLRHVGRAMTAWRAVCESSAPTTTFLNTGLHPLGSGRRPTGLAEVDAAARGLR